MTKYTNEETNKRSCKVFFFKPTHRRLNDFVDLLEKL